MFFSQKAYLNANGTGQVLNLNHDVKRVLAESKAQNGLLNITSVQATSSVVILESDATIQKTFLEFIRGFFAEFPDNKVVRRSGTGPDRYHYMAALSQLSLTIPFEKGRLSISPFQDILALDYDPKVGRREFLITILGDAGEAKQQ